MDISIIIVNYNSTKLIRQCIASITEHIKINYEIIVVDNNSPERDILSITDEYPGIRLILNAENNGFGYANNIGADNSKGELLLFLNPDTYLIDDSVNEMISYYQTSQIGILAPLILNPDLTVQYGHDKFHSFMFMVAEAFNYHNKYINRSIEKDKSLTDLKPFKIGWALGAAVLIKKEIFIAAGKFDSRFFLYYEDADLAINVNKAGYTNYCFPACRLVHVLSATSGDRSFSKHHVHRSRIIYISKHFNILQNILLRYVFILSLLLRIILIPFIRNNKDMNFKHITGNMKLYFKRADTI